MLTFLMDNATTIVVGLVVLALVVLDVRYIVKEKKSHKGTCGCGCGCSGCPNACACHKD